MRVTRFQYPLEKNLVTKLNLIVKRVDGDGSKKDAVIICEGSEGEGKTTLSVALAYYFSEQTGRKFDHTHLFFEVEKMMKFAQDTEKQIIIWDEPALQALSTDWASSAVKNLTRLLMMARKKRHIIIINMTKFYKFNEYIVVDRSICLIHVYSRKNIYSGRFMYIKKKELEALWRDYRFSKKRTYYKHAAKRIKGTFPDILNPKYKYNVLSEFDNDAYEKKKDEAIAMVGATEKKITPKEVVKETIIKFMTENNKKKDKLTQKTISGLFGISVRTVQRYASEIVKRKSGASTPPIINYGDSDEDNPDKNLEKTEEKDDAINKEEEEKKDE